MGPPGVGGMERVAVGRPGNKVAVRFGSGVVSCTSVAVGRDVEVAVAGSGVGENAIAVSVSCAATVAAAEVKIAAGSTAVASASVAVLPPQAVRVKAKMIKINNQVFFVDFIVFSVSD